MPVFFHDLKLAFRAFIARPGFSFLVTAMLAMGIAGNVTIFTIYSGLFLRPLPLKQPDRVVDLDETAPKWNLRFVSIAKPDFDAWREHNRTFDSMAVYDLENFNLSGRGAAERLQAARVSADMMKVLGVRPAPGRDFLPTEDRAGGARVVLISERVWRERLGGDPAILGQILKLDEEPYTVVGVLPRQAMLSVPVDIWVPLAADPNDRHGWSLRGMGRLKPGVTVEQARADLTRIHRALIAEGRKDNAITTPTVMPLNDRSLGTFRPAGNLLLGASGIVLLIACANIAGLMMVRAAARSREVAIRTALGASRGSILRQLLTESLFYAATGGVAGVLLGKAMLRMLVASVPPLPIPWLDFSMDYRAGLFATGITGLAAVLFGLAPALSGLRTDVRAALHGASRATATGGRRFVLNALITGELGLAVILLVTAALLFQALRKTLQVDPGFRPQGVLTYRIATPRADYPDRPSVVNLIQRLEERMRTLPGVTAAGAVTLPPLSGHWGQFFTTEGAPPLAAGEQNPVVLQVLATPGYFDTAGITLLAGRQFTERDGVGDNRVAIVNESFAKRFFPGQNPIGRRIRYTFRKEWIEIVGVTRDVKHYGLDQEMRPGVFVPFRQWVVPVMTMVLRTPGDPNALVGPAREALRQMDPALPMFEVTTLSEAVDRSLWTRRFYSSVSFAFALVALLLAAGGVYGVVSYAVSRRTQELGIRIALGATPTRVMRQVLGHGMVMLAIALPAGLAGTLAVSGLVENLLFGVKARDPLTYAAVAVAMAAVALAANLVPARRAAAIAPTEALRSE
jgi:predicted permease